ncbi:MAG: PAS domain S-box protein, partial [Pyrinomonadaceae bacterium]
MLRVIRRSSLVRYGAALVVVMALMLFAVPGLWRNLFATGAGGDSFMTHYNCYLQIAPLVSLHFVSDLLIGAAYVSISLTLAYLVNRARRDIPFHWVFLAFGVFIVACGSTHFMEAWTTFRAPVYWLAGYLKLVTAVASVGTAVALPPLVPRALALVRDAKLSERRRLELEAANRQLETFYRRAKELEEVKSRALSGEAQGGGGALAAAQMPLPLSRLERLALAPLVLVAADDAETSRRVAESVCESCRVESAGGGREALERARSVEPDLIVCDAASAGMTGEEFVGAVRAEGRLRDVPVMVLAAGDEAERVRLLREGAQDYMTKPFVAEELRARAENLIEIKLTRELLQHELASQSRDLTELAREVAARRRELERTVGELRESNFKLEAIIKASPLAIVALDREGLVRSWNPAAERIYGWSQEEVLGEPLPTVPEEGRAEMERNHRAAVGGTIFSGYETKRVRKDGSTVEVSISTSPLLGEGGEAAGVVALVADVTERKRAEAALREQSEVIEQAYDAIFLRDPSNSITLWNRGAERTYGFTKEEALARSPHELLKTVTPIPLAEIYASLRREGFWEGELRHTRKDGAQIVVESRWATIRDDRGEVASILEIVRDITERKRADEALRGSEERYRAFVAQSSEAIWRIEFAAPIPVSLPEAEQIERYYREGYLAECNDVMARMYGFSRAEELHGSRLGDMLPRTEENMAYLRAAIRAGYRLTDAESQELDRDGNNKYFLNNLVGIIEGGLLRRVWGTQRDVTERKRAEVELVESRRELQIVTDSAPLFISSCDRDARYIFVNEPFAARLGLAR